LLVQKGKDDGSVCQPYVSSERRTFKDKTLVTMSSATKGATLYYTLDGTTPHAASKTYTTPFFVEASSEICAIAMASDKKSLPAKLAVKKVKAFEFKNDPTLVLWLRADSLLKSLKANDAVTEWPSLVNAVKLVVPKTTFKTGGTADAPTLADDPASGLAAVSFNGKKNLLTAPGFVNKFLAGKPFSLIMVTKSASKDFGLVGNGTNGDGAIPRLYITRSGIIFNEHKDAIKTTAQANAIEISEFLWDVKGTLSMYLNGSFIGKQDNLTPVTQFGGGNLAIPISLNGVSHPGEFYELLVFDKALNEVERKGIEVALQERYFK
jgi:hypothetical protein